MLKNMDVACVYDVRFIRQSGASPATHDLSR